MGPPNVYPADIRSQTHVLVGTMQSTTTYYYTIFHSSSRVVNSRDVVPKTVEAVVVVEGERERYFVKCFIKGLTGMFEM